MYMHIHALTYFLEIKKIVLIYIVWVPEDNNIMKDIHYKLSFRDT